MNGVRISPGIGVSTRTQSLYSKAVSPLCGIAQGISFITRAQGEPRFMISGGDLCNLEVWRRSGRKLVLAHHIGGGGVTREEPILKSVAEAVERYSSILSALQVSECQNRTASANSFSMSAVFDLRQLDWFTSKQLLEPGFPFKKVNESSPLCWVRLFEVSTKEPILVPAQLVLVGYECDESVNEPRMMPAVTTGTAVHTTVRAARLNALLELIQIDAVMGHWYSSSYPAYQFFIDDRLPAIRKLIHRHWSSTMPYPQFYCIPTLGFDQFVVIAAVVSDQGPPYVGFGQGIDSDLERATYKALIEGVGVFNLAKITQVEATGDNLVNRSSSALGTAQVRFDNLDKNVLYYSERGNAERALKIFDRSGQKSVTEIIGDRTINDAGFLDHRFNELDIRVYEQQMKIPECSQLGLHGARFWSPDLLPLCIPEYPYINHARHMAYGGFYNNGPHPYP
jgi:thiazole/oxazole-forming peptide maturase SagD family component